MPGFSPLAQSNCRMNISCVKCVEDHRAKETKATFANWSLAANYRRCQKMSKLITKTTHIVPDTSYTMTTKSQTQNMTKTKNVTKIKSATETPKQKTVQKTHVIL